MFVLDIPALKILVEAVTNFIPLLCRDGVWEEMEGGSGWREWVGMKGGREWVGMKGVGGCEV